MVETIDTNKPGRSIAEIVAYLNRDSIFSGDTLDKEDQAMKGLDDVKKQREVVKLQRKCLERTNSKSEMFIPMAVKEVKEHFGGQLEQKIENQKRNRSTENNKTEVQLEKIKTYKIRIRGRKSWIQQLEGLYLR